MEDNDEDERNYEKTKVVYGSVDEELVVKLE